MRYNALRVGDLQAMTPGERDNVLSQLASEALAPTNGQLVAVNARIRSYEAQYELSSAQLLAGLEKREIRETAEIASWLFLLSVRAHSERQEARSKQPR